MEEVNVQEERRHVVGHDAFLCLYNGTEVSQDAI